MSGLERDITELCAFNEFSVEFVRSAEIEAIRKNVAAKYELCLGASFINFSVPECETVPSDSGIRRYLFELFHGQEMLLLLENDELRNSRDSGFVFQRGQELSDVVNLMYPFPFCATSLDLRIAVLFGNAGYLSVFGDRKSWVPDVMDRIASLGADRRIPGPD